MEDEEEKEDEEEAKETTRSEGSLRQLFSSPVLCRHS